MRTLVLLDTKIDKDEALSLLDDFSEFFEKHTGIQCEWFVERRDFSIVPTVPDADGDLKPTREYRQALETDVHKRYGDYGTDNITMFVHEDNFLFKGLWGVNWSYNFFKYSLQLCRWDKDNPVNTFNTFFHEGGPGHSADAVIRKELGIDINRILQEWILKNGRQDDKKYINTLIEDWKQKNPNKKDIPIVFDWDRDYIHGRLPSVQYMGTRGYTYSDDNLRFLKLIAVDLKRAYDTRKEKHEKHVGLYKQIIALLSTLVSLLKKQRGV